MRNVPRYRYERRLLSGEENPPRPDKDPASCKHCKCTAKRRPLMKAWQTMSHPEETVCTQCIWVGRVNYDKRREALQVAG